MAAGLSPDCPSDEAIAAYLDGTLDHHARGSLEKHIVRCGACRGLIGDAAHGALNKTDASSTESPLQEAERVTDAGHLPRPGDVIADKYLVDGYLGRGSMGWVLAARHRALGHKVAIKVLRSDGPAAARRFLVEAQTCARLSHPNIPRVFDIGQLPAGAPFMVMEYLVGKDLAVVAAQGPVAIHDAVRWVSEACEALAEAHAAGIVHRDLKPANLFLVEGPGGQTTVKVLDFGISKIARHVTTGTTEGETATGVVVGSPLYMSPEQIRAAKPIDQRSDIWALGVILYELTTGQPPFRGPGLPALSVAIVVEPPVRPSTVRADFPRELERIVLRCLAKSPDNRYSTVAELAADLRWFRGEGRPRGMQRRRRLIVAVALLLAGIGLVAVRRHRSAPAVPAVSDLHPPIDRDRVEAPQPLQPVHGSAESAHEVLADPPSPGEAVAMDQAPVPHVRELERGNARGKAVPAPRGTQQSNSPLRGVDASPSSQSPVKIVGPLDTPD